MFIKPARVFKMIGLAKGLEGSETSDNPDYKSLPGMKQAKKVAAPPDFKFQPHFPKKIVYGSKDIEV